MNLRWKGGQLKLPIGPDQKNVIFELYSIISMLELLISLITLILKCAAM